jgi:hypothetical protein
MNYFRELRHFSCEHDTFELFPHCSKRRDISTSFQKTVQVNKALLDPGHSGNIFRKQGNPAVCSANREFLRCIQELGHSCSISRKQGTPALCSANRELLQCDQQTGNTCSLLSKQVTPEIYSGNRELLQSISGRRAHSSDGGKA